MTRTSTPRRGRPPKFNRPSKLVAMTLPEDALEAMRGVHPDPAWAVVRLLDGLRQGRTDAPAEADPLPGIVEVSRHHALIMVDPRLVRDLPRVATIPIDETRAFLALDQGGTLADLELAVLDRLDAPGVAKVEQDALRAFRAQLKKWRTDPSLQFEARTIIVVGRRVAVKPRVGARRVAGT